MQLPFEKDGILGIFTSDIQRSIDTGKIIGKKYGITKMVVDPILSEYPYTDERIEELGLSGGKWLLLEEASKLLARKIAKFILDKLENNDTIQNHKQIVAVSHIPPIMAFLGYALAHTKGKFSIDEEIKSELFESFGGGFVKPLEGFEILYDGRTDKDHLSIVLAGHNLQIPISLLRELTI